MRNHEPTPRLTLSPPRPCRRAERILVRLNGRALSRCRASFGLDDRQRVANIGEEPIEANEYQAIDSAEARPPWRRPPQDATSKTSTTPRASRFCARLGDKLERIKSCSSGAAVFIIEGDSSQQMEHAAQSLNRVAGRQARLPHASSILPVEAAGDNEQVARRAAGS